MIWKFPYYDINSGVDWESIKESFNWFREMEAIPQDPIWHAEGNVMIHTKLVCESLLNLPEFKELDEQDKHIMFTSALMHDIEKRSTTKEDFIDGRICIVAPKHAKKGEYTTRMVLYRDIKTPFHIREEICKLVRYHGVPLWSNDNLERTIIEISQFTSNYKLAMLSKADVLGRVCNDQLQFLEKIDFYLLASSEYNCLHNPKSFKSNLSRYTYFSKKTYIDYVPFDESKFKVIMLSGVPGSGKDTYIKNNIGNLDTISLDDIRREMKIKPTDNKGNGQVIQEAIERCKIKMRVRESFIFNSTNITRDLRSKWITLFEEYGGCVDIYYIEVSYDKLLTQNNDRVYGVPVNVVEKLLNKLEVPTFKEVSNVIYITE